MEKLDHPFTGAHRIWGPNAVKPCLPLAPLNDWKTSRAELAPFVFSTRRYRVAKPTLNRLLVPYKKLKLLVKQVDLNSEVAGGLVIWEYKLLNTLISMPPLGIAAEVTYRKELFAVKLDEFPMNFTSFSVQSYIQPFLAVLNF